MPSAKLNRLRFLADLLDTRFGVPGTDWRFGFDGIFGLVPGIGDTVGALLSLYIVFEARRLGVNKGTIARMLGNVLIDSLIGAVPVIGDFFDFVWKSNVKNIALLERDILQRETETATRRLS